MCKSCEEKLHIASNFLQLFLKSQNFVQNCLEKINSKTDINARDVSTKKNFNISSIYIEQKLQDLSVSNEKPDYIVIQSVIEKNIDSTEKDCLEQNNIKEILFKPVQCQKNTMTNQTMRLAQYSTADVTKLIREIKERYSRQQICLLCNFISKDLRAMSVHMTKIHK